MNRPVQLALCTMTWLIGIALLVSCTTSPLPEPPPQEEQASRSKLEPPRQARHRALGARMQGEAAYGAAADYAVSPAMGLSRYESSEEQVPAWDTVSPGAEIWVIARESAVSLVDEDTPDPGSGALVANMPSDNEEEGGAEVPLPLQHTAVDAAIAGHISTVRIKQQFANPFDTKIEAVYVFPLPENAAVTEFLMVIGERTIRGILREKEEAEAIYRAARDQGYQASLLVQRRPNIFEQKVANIEPGKAIDVDITYFSTLAYRDGWYSFVFPTVVGPRFNPPGHPDPVQALPRGGRTKTPGGTALEYLAPAERSGHDLGITVSIDAGVHIEEITSTHEITVEQDGPASATVQLA